MRNSKSTAWVFSNAPLFYPGDYCLYFALDFGCLAAWFKKRRLRENSRCNNSTVTKNVMTNAFIWLLNTYFFRNIRIKVTLILSDKTLGYDIHGFQDSRLALVRRSMIARRTQLRLREKRRRNRTVALSPEDDRRSSFISTFLAGAKMLHDQSCQVPSRTSTLSNKDEVNTLHYLMGVVVAF